MLIEKILGNKMKNYSSEIKELEELLVEKELLLKRERILADKANILFSNNKSMFEEYYPDIGKFISGYQPREDFCLHATADGAANFVPSGSSIPLYGDSPLDQAQKQVEYYTKNANYSRRNYFLGNEVKTNDERIHIQYVAKLYNSFLECSELEVLKELPEHYPTCLVFGIGLGYHLPALLEQHTFDYLFICEPDEELFYASLFCIDWSKIVKDIDDQGGCLFLNIGIGYNEFFNSVSAISEDIGAFSLINSFCYQHYPSDEINKAIKEYFDNYYHLHHGYGFYNDAITGLSHAIHNIENNIPCFIPNRQGQQSMKNVPIFVIGNGPSLDESLTILKKYQGKAIILAGGTALQSLEKAGIDCDFHILVERTKLTLDIQKAIKPESGYQQKNLLAVDVMYPDVFDLYNWGGMGMKGPEAASSFIRLQILKNFNVNVRPLPGAGPLVCNTALSYALNFGSKDIYLFGVDNGAVDVKQSHSKLSIYKDKNFSDKFKPLEGASIKLNGNLDSDVYATTFMSIAKRNMDILLSNLKDVNVYNVGEGAEIENAYPTRENELLLSNLPDLDKTKIIADIKKNFFKAIPKNDLEADLAFDMFDELCDHLISIGKREFNSRNEAHELMKAQQRVIYSYRKTKYEHLFHMLKGSLLYIHCPLVTLLYYYKDEKETLKVFRKAFDVWLDFLETVKVDFRLNFKTKCNWSRPEFLEEQCENNEVTTSA